MSLPAGFITTLNGKRCTAVPRSDLGGGAATSASTSAAVAVAVATPAPATTTVAPVLQIAAVAIPSTTSVEVPTVALVAATTQQSAAETSAVLQAQDVIASTPASASIPPASASTPPANTQTIPIAPVIPAAITTPSSASIPTSTTPNIASSASTTQPSVVGQGGDPGPINVASSTISATSSATSNAFTAVGGFIQSEITESSATTSSQERPTTVESMVPSQTGALATQASINAESDTMPGISNSRNKVTVGPVVGGIVGGLAFLAILGCLWLYYRRRRRNRDSLLTPLWVQSEKSPPTAYYEIDNNSVGPTRLSEKWRAQANSRFGDIIGAFKAKIGQTPSINMNRGNSQFLEPIPQHSRNPSTVSHDSGHLSKREQARDWWDRLTADALFNWSLRRAAKPGPKDPAASSHFTRAASPSAQPRARSPDFREYLATKDRELREVAEHRRSLSLPPHTRPKSQLGSGLEFSDVRGDNPFADDARMSTLPVSAGRRNSSVPAGRPLSTNPFADPTQNQDRYKPTALTVTRPEPAISSDYVADVRRSRGASVDGGAARSRYASTIRTSRDSYRDSTATANTRRGKGRSDPFDLERPELWRGGGAGMTIRTSARMSTTLSDVQELPSTAGSSADGQRVGEVAVGLPRVVSLLKKENSTRTRVESGGAGERGRARESGARAGAESWTSRYSRASSAGFSEWGDPGPDLGPRGGYMGRPVTPPGSAGSGGVGKAM